MSDTEKASYVEDPSLQSVSDTNDVEKLVVAQIVQESDHEIKYRTCSWQKVRNSHSLYRMSVLTILDSSVTVLGIHMLSHLVFSMVRIYR